MKIAIIGYSGSGKSTLAKRLADEIGVSPLYLDRVHFLPGWAERENDEARAIVREELQKSDWVIDGNYRQLLREQRLHDADEIILLNYPRLVCLARALRRHRDFRNRTRESAADGCIEKMDAEFVRWILFGGRTREKRQGYRDVAVDYPDKTVVVRNDRELERYLSNRADGKRGT
ncbi:MAG: DNA topology modulation protein FlaR [Clostridiales bacterium]|nr:DNA topology modulation protein FlaR [Clostridiales bacterium]